MNERKRNYEKEWDDLAEMIFEERFLRGQHYPPQSEKWKFKINNRRK